MTNEINEEQDEGVLDEGCRKARGKSTPPPRNYSIIKFCSRIQLIYWFISETINDFVERIGERPLISPRANQEQLLGSSDNLIKWIRNNYIKILIS